MAMSLKIMLEKMILVSKNSIVFKQWSF